MAEETRLRFRCTLGSVIMWISFLPPIVVLLARPHYSSVIYSCFDAAEILLILGFLVYCWEEYREKRPFSKETLVCVTVVIILYLIIAPAFVSTPSLNTHRLTERPRIRAPGLYFFFYASDGHLILGFLIYSLEDYRAGRKFSSGMLFYVCLMLFVYLCISPIVVAAAP